MKVSELEIKESFDGELYFRLPDDLLDRLGWKEGDNLKFIPQDDAFIIKFSEPTRINLIRKIKPNILIKGGDYKKSEIVGGDFVIKNKGILKIIPFVKGCSTSNIIKKINKLSD